MATYQDVFKAADDAGIRRFVRGLNIIVAAAVALSGLGVLLAPVHSYERIVVMLIGFATVAGSEWQLRRNPQRAVLVLAAGFWGLTALNAIFLAGIHSSANVVFPFVIALVGWALGTRWLAVVTTASVAFLGALAILEAIGWFVPTERAPIVSVVTTHMSLLPVMAYLTYAAKKQLSESRIRALALSHDMGLLLNNVPTAIASFDAQSVLRSCNQRYADFFAKNVSDIVGKHIDDYIPSLALEQMRPYWDQALQGKTQTYRRFNVHPVTNELTWLDATVTPEFDGAVVTGLYAVLMDVTDKVQAEAEIQALNTDLEARVTRRTRELEKTLEELHASREELLRSQAKASLSALVASVSHELSTPIGNGVLVASTLRDTSQKLQQQLQDNQLRRSTLTELNSSLNEGSRLLLSNLARAETLLKNFKQMSADQVSEQRRTFDLARVISEVVVSLNPSLKRQSHVIVQDVPEGISMDSLPGPLGQVIINLINNAYMHAFEGRNDGILTISTEVQEETVTLRFSDNGVGIAPEVLPNLFEPFFSTKIGHGGTGLGMSIVEGIVRKTLGGSMSVQSTLGVGTTFDVRIPKRAPCTGEAS